jgi:NADPH:quinone reductase-like Zn-dependent oxidoreductase
VQVGQPKLPRQKATAGCRTAGIVETVGPDVTAFAVGDAVFGKSNFPGGGSYAEFVAVPATDIVRKPPSIDHAQAAAIPGGALTAWLAMSGDGALELAAGRTLLILGAAGGVGGFAVQLAKWKGARVVAAGRAAQEAHPRALGAVSSSTRRGEIRLWPVRWMPCSICRRRASGTRVAGAQARRRVCIDDERPIGR